MAQPPFPEELSLFDFKDDTAPPSQSGRTTLDLPASYLDPTVQILNVHDVRSLTGFLHVELDVRKLNRVHKHLWLAGQERFPRALQHQTTLGRAVVCTEDPNLHLLWSGSRLFVKPCPDFLLCHSIWASHLCTDKFLYKKALGMLLSYVWLVRHRSDLTIAQSSGLLPSTLSWPLWTRLSAAILATADIQHGKVTAPINPRYYYGELRLDRLNWIYALCSQTRRETTLMRGYFNSYHDYESFFERHIAWITAATVYVALVLTAMQVGLATTELQNNLAFRRASYGFTVFAILGPIGALVLLVPGIMGMMFVQNLRHTLKLRRQGKEFNDRKWEDEAVRNYVH